MKICFYVVLSSVFILMLSCKKQAGTTSGNSSNSGFEKHLGGNEDDFANSIVLKNGLLYVFGTTKSMGETNGDHYLIQMNTEGVVLFEKTYGGSQAEDGNKIIKTSDGNLVLLGSTESSGNGMKDIHLMKINVDGDLLWEKTYGGIADDFPNNIIEKNNGDLIIAATTESFGAGGRDIYLIWTSPNGDVLQDKVFGKTQNDGSADLIEVENNDIMLYAYTNNFGATSQDMFLMRLNEAGDSLWSKRYGGGDYEESQGFAQTAQGDFILHGHSASTDPIHDMYAVKVNENGDQLWEKNYGGAMHDGGTAMLINNQGNYVMLARSMSFGTGDRSIYMVTTNSDGTLISDDVIGGDQDDWALDIVENGAFYYIVGHSNSESMTNTDAYIVKYQK